MLAQAQQYISGNVPLVVYTRGGYIEAVNRGAFAVVTSRGETLYERGRTDIPVTFRSCIKPFQLMSVLHTEADREYGLTGAELALAAASHSGEPMHIETARSILNKLGLDESALRCGAHKPFDSEVAMELGRLGITPSPISNNCSGKHAAMLAVCRKMGWAIDSYEDPKHPLQKMNEKFTGAFADLVGELPIVVDGCTVPTFALPLSNGAYSYARLAHPETAPEGMAEYARRVFAIMNEHPEYGSGSKNRLEAKLMRDFPGTVVAKVGAEACYTVGIAPGVLHEDGVGIALKMEDGISFNRSVDAAIVGILEQLGLIESSKLEQYTQFLPRCVRDNRGNKVGEVEVLFNLKEPLV